jgi:pyrimidine oxygenase
MALELGIFLPVTNNGWILSPSAPPAPPTFALNRAIAQDAERRGFHFLLAQSVWRGHGGVTDFWNTSLEGFTLMTALAGVTERLGLVASVQPLLYPPPVAAKMVATADHVSNGRFGINVVAGANLTEFEQMAVLPPDWGDVRYDYASEWIEAVKRLWGPEPSVATKGDWIELAGCISNPKPQQTPTPPIVCAGSSPRGMRFALEHGTHAFIGGRDLEDLAAINARYRTGAAELGRSIKTYTAVHYIIEDTDAAAAAAVQQYRDDPDVDAIADLVGEYSRDGAGESLRRTIVEAGEHVFFGGVVAGSPETVAEHVAGVDAAGLDGLLVIFTDWSGGLARFCDEVLPSRPGLAAPPSVDWARPAPVELPPVSVGGRGCGRR